MIEARDVSTHGIRLRCHLAGEGPLVVLLHGFPERWFSWEPQLRALAAAGYRAVAPDLRGYGDSDRPARGYGIDSLCADIAGLIEALGETSATVIGHDWGGALTWCVAERYPTLVRRFAVLNCPHPWVLRKVGLFGSRRQLARSWYILFFGLPGLPERLMARGQAASIPRIFRGNAFDRTRFTDALIQPYRDSVRGPDDVTPMLAYYRAALRGALRPLAPPRPIDAPGLLLWAEEDRALGTELISPHLAFARSLRVERIPACGHFVQIERPDEVSAHLCRWLAETEVSS
ncbi:MAG: alpha/beta hydrolase [Polyangiales bacterium]